MTSTLYRLAAECVGTCGLVFAGPISGASMNPARSLAPAIVSQTWQDQWLDVAGPAIGAVIGVLIDNATRSGEITREP